MRDFDLYPTTDGLTVGQKPFVAHALRADENIGPEEDESEEQQVRNPLGHVGVLRVRLGGRFVLLLLLCFGDGGSWLLIVGSAAFDVFCAIVIVVAVVGFCFRASDAGAP